MELLFLHDLASGRSDGLHPELLRLFRQRAALSASTVVELRPGGVRRSAPRDPNPPRITDRGSPGDVIRFPSRPKSTLRNP